MSRIQHTSSCPNAEDLAVYIDGSASAAEHAAVEEHLAACIPCQEIIAESTRVLAAAGPKKADSRSTTTWRLAAPLAAAAALVLAVSLFQGRQSWDQQLVRNVAQAVAEGEAMPFRGWSELRGGNSVMPEEDVSFRLGVMAVDLEVAAMAGVKEEVSTILPALTFNIDKIPFSQPTSAIYHQIQSDLSDMDSGALIEALEEAESRLGSLDSPVQYRLGRWAALQTFDLYDQQAVQPLRKEARALLATDLDEKDRSILESFLARSLSENEINEWIADH